MGPSFFLIGFFFYRFEFERNEHVITTSSQTALDKWTLTLTSSTVLKSVCSRQSTRKSVWKEVLNNVRLLCLGASGSDKYMVNWVSCSYISLPFPDWNTRIYLHSHLFGLNRKWLKYECTLLPEITTVCIVALVVPLWHRIKIVLKRFSLILSQESKIFELDQFVSRLFH